MEQSKYTSLKLSKLLAENGCELESEWIYIENAYTQKYKESFRDYGHRGEIIIEEDGRDEYGTIMIKGRSRTDVYQGQTCRAYDIMCDLCIKYAKDVWPEHLVLYGPYQMICYLQKGKQDEAEAYLWENCLFNPKNK